MVWGFLQGDLGNIEKLSIVGLLGLAVWALWRKLGEKDRLIEDLTRELLEHLKIAGRR